MAMDKSTKTILLVGAAAVAVYLLTRKRTSSTLPPGYVAPAYNPQLTQQNQTASTINAGANALNTLNNIVSQWFKPSTPTTATVSQPTYAPPAIDTTLTQPIRI